MKKYSLNGVWDLYYFKENTLNITSPEELIKSNVPKIKGKVPGNCELDLSDAGILPKDLFMGENIRKLKEFEEYEYWYVTEFKKPDLDFSKKVCIEFDGVDCLADAVDTPNDVERGNRKNNLYEKRKCFDLIEKFFHNVYAPFKI